METLQLFRWPSDFSSLEHQYPRVEELTLGSDYQPTDVRPIIHAHPNLRKLNLHIEEILDWEEMELDREANMSVQALHGSWENLDYLYGSLECLYPLALQCKVKHLRSHGRLRDGHGAGRLEAVLSDVRPSILTFNWFDSGLDLAFLLPILHPAKERLTTLIWGVFPRSETWTDPYDQIVRNQVILRVLSQCTHALERFMYSMRCCRDYQHSLCSNSNFAFPGSVRYRKPLQTMMISQVTSLTCSIRRALRLHPNIWIFIVLQCRLCSAYLRCVTCVLRHHLERRGSGRCSLAKMMELDLEPWWNVRPTRVGLGRKSG